MWSKTSSLGGSKLGLSSESWAEHRCLVVSPLGEDVRHDRVRDGARNGHERQDHDELQHARVEVDAAASAARREQKA